MDVLCPFCDARSTLRFRANDLNNRITEDTFHYYSCSSCGLLYLSPIPEDLEKFYQGDYIAYDIPSSLTQLKAKAEKDVHFRIDMVRQYAPKSGRLLEIGPSYGAFSYLAKEAGFTVDAIEMDPDCCRFLNDIVGINAICNNDVTRAVAPLGQYDVIALWHVIEHLARPWEVMSALAEHLLPNGIIVISTPNPESFQFRLLGRFWAQVDAPRHLTLIPVQWLVRLLGERGVHPIKLTTTDPDGQKLNRFGWSRSFHNLLSNPLFKYSRFIVASLFNLGFCHYERTGLHGSAYTLIAQREPGICKEDRLC